MVSVLGIGMLAKYCLLFEHLTTSGTRTSGATSTITTFAGNPIGHPKLHRVITNCLQTPVLPSRTLRIDIQAL